MIIIKIYTILNDMGEVLREWLFTIQKTNRGTRNKMIRQAVYIKWKEELFHVMHDYIEKLGATEFFRFKKLWQAQNVIS